ncbi:MAG: hypothetical protein HY562_00145 [Ignavibacteriales bacterium]|nr:hypothetical protein [Ignavibacteriales bacterium]
MGVRIIPAIVLFLLAMQLASAAIITGFSQLEYSKNFSINTSSLALMTGNTTRLFISDSGMIGIGTLEPIYTLQIASGIDGKTLNVSDALYVNGSSGSVGIGVKNGTAYLDIRGATGTTASIRILTGSPPSTPLVGDIYSDGTDLFFYDGTTWQDLTRETGSAGGWTDTGDIVALTTASDFVGIGTSTPTEKLQVSGNTSVSEDIYVGGNVIALGSSGASDFSAGWADDGQIVRLATSSDRVGIGTADTLFKLEVLGNASFNRTLYVLTSGRVGIGTDAPASTLEIAGTTRTEGLNVTGTAENATFEGDVQIKGTLYGGSPLKVAGGLNLTGTFTLEATDQEPIGATEGTLFFNSSSDTLRVFNGSVWQDIGTGSGGAPIGTIAAFKSSCPDGWTEYTSARGRYLVGTPAAGSPESTVGTALSDQENRAVGEHNHSASGLTFAGDALSGHSHGVTDPGHGHNVNYWPGGGGGDTTQRPARVLDDGSSSLSQNTGSQTTGISINSGSAGTPSGTIGGFSAKQGSVAGTSAPYIQIIWCEKTSDDTSSTAGLLGSSGSNVFLQDTSNKFVIGSTSTAHKFEVIGNVSLNKTLYVLENGRVGIGTTTPAAKLQIGDASRARLMLGSESQFTGVLDIFGAYSGTNKIINVTDAARNPVFMVQGDGDIGIGTASPSSKASIDRFIHIKGTGHGGLVMEGAGGTTQEILGSGVGITFYSNTTETVRIASSGNVGIGDTAPAIRLSVIDSAAANQRIVGIGGSGSSGGFSNLLVGSDADRVGLYLSDNAETHNLWVDDADVLRIKSTYPTSNTDGGVVGAQTSSLDAKHIVGEFTDYEYALSAILEAPLFNFSYKSGAYHNQTFTGLITDYSPVFGMDRDSAHPGGKSLNEITAIGYLFAAIKEQQSKIEELEGEVVALKSQHE